MSQKIKLSATIPTVQYGNVMPEIEVEAETYEEALQIAEGRLRDIWNRYVEKGKELPESSGRVKLEAFIGGQIYYDELTHTYTNEAGEVYLSGSVYADSFRKPFDKLSIASAMAKKVGVSPDDILAMWELKSKSSRDFGSAIHEALQLHEQYGALCEALEKTTNMHDHPTIKNAVHGFVEAHKHEKALSEVLIVDHAAKRAGRLDRLVITKPQHCIIDDFKTNANLEKDLDVYWKQLEFYRDIMLAAGWSVDGLRIHHFNGDWTTHEYATAPSKPSKSPATEVARQSNITESQQVRAGQQYNNHRAPQLP